MKMKILVFLALSLCAYAAEVKEKESKAEPEQNKDKRQTEDEFIPTHLIYRTSNKQEQVAPVEEQQEEEREPINSRISNQQYRPGQVFSLNAQELLELQPERKAPLPTGNQLQQLYSNPQPDHRQNLQQIYYLEPQGARQVSLQPSHAVIARPNYSFNGGEASVGAALSVSDSGVNQADNYDAELLALLGQAPIRPEVDRQPAYQSQQVQASTQTVVPQYQQVSTQSVAPQYPQVDRYIPKPSKKPTKLRPKVHSLIAPPQASAAPQQYLIETTNVQPQQPQPQPLPQSQPQALPQPLPQYRPAPQPQRVPQALRFIPIPTAQAYVQQALYDRPETQGLKVVAPPKLQQPRPQLAYRVVTQYQPAEASPKQYRIIEAPRPQPVRQEIQRIPASSIERPVTYLKRFPEPEKVRAVKIYEPISQERLPQPQTTQNIDELQQYYLRPLYRPNDQRSRYELTPVSYRPVEQNTYRPVEQNTYRPVEQNTYRPVEQNTYKPIEQNVYRPIEQNAYRPIEQNVQIESTKPPHSAIYVSKNVSPKKVARPQPTQSVKVEQLTREPTSAEQANAASPSLEEQRAQLPPPKNNRAYTPEEFQALVAAGYSVTPIPVAPLGAPAQSRSGLESAAPAPRRPLYSRRNQYLPLRGDDAP